VSDLFDALLQVHDRAQALAVYGCTPWGSPDGTFEGRIALALDARLPAETVRAILYTLGQAGFDQPYLLVQTRAAGPKDGPASGRSGDLQIPLEHSAYVLALGPLPSAELALGRAGGMMQPLDLGVAQASGAQGPSVHGVGLGPSVSVPSDPVVLGSLDASAIVRVVQPHLAPLLKCYHRALADTPGLAGKVTITFVVGPDGKVTSSGIKSSTLGDAGAESCMTQRFLRMSFPPLDGGGVSAVSYPLVFSPGPHK
jgi:hypothetical protein